ncbi:MAG: hypothetical protein J2P53_10365, partial [Bradyrhizobiaceae bacterium]|nr:hypothetical protein [Bradyrhizobiaceae bacterium]
MQPRARITEDADGIAAAFRPEDRRFSRLPANSGSDAIADEPMGLTARYIPRLRPGVEDLPRHR